MTQKRSPGTGGQFIADATQLPTDLTWPAVPARSDRMEPLVSRIKFRDVADTSADFVFTFVAEDNGKVGALIAAAGSVAADGTNGIKLVVTNKSNSDDVLASFGIGSATNAAAGVDDTTALTANSETEIACSDTSFFNKGDVIKITATRDGTTFVMSGVLVVEYQSQGR